MFGGGQGGGVKCPRNALKRKQHSVLTE